MTFTFVLLVLNFLRKKMRFLCFTQNIFKFCTVILTLEFVPQCDNNVIDRLKC